MRVLNRLDEMRGVLQVDIPTETMSRMYEIAENYEPKAAEAADEDEVEFRDSREANEENVGNRTTRRLLSASCTYLQSVVTGEVPYHCQIVVPGCTGMANASPQQTYEVSIWERNLLQIFWQEGVNCTRFEFCSGREPLIIDVFATPAVDSAELYWKSAFEEFQSDGDDRVIKLKSRSLKQMFPPTTSYAAVIFDEGTTMIRLCDSRAHDPREAAIDVVASLWQETDEQPPIDMDDRIIEFKEWPRS